MIYMYNIIINCETEGVKQKTFVSEGVQPKVQNICSGRCITKIGHGRKCQTKITSAICRKVQLC